MSTPSNTTNNVPGQTQQPPPHQQPRNDDGENDWKSLKFRANLAPKVKAACESLKEDGSNYVDWEFRLSNYVKNITATRNWLTDATIGRADTVGDVVVQQMIQHTIPTETARKVEDCNSAFDSMSYIKSLFFFPSCSAHTSMFKSIINVKLTDNMDINEYFRIIRSKFSDIKRAGFVWNEDSVMGMIFQTGVPTDYTNINITLNARLCTNPTSVISAKEVEEAIRAEKHNKPDEIEMNQLNLSNTNQHSPMNINVLSRQQRIPTPRLLPQPQAIQRTVNQSNYRQRANPNFRPLAPQQRVYTNNNVNAAVPMTRTNAPPNTQANYQAGPKSYQCFACGSADHWVRAFPYYLDANNNEFTVEPDDAYPLDNGPTGEDDKPNGIWASESHLTEEWDNPDEGVSDTGATHMITGDLSRLTDIHVLHRPIPISVATKNNKAFVTAKGTLHIRADDGSSIPIKNTYYSPAAQCTLILIPEIVESGGSWKGSNGAMRLSFPCGRTASAVYKNRKWVFYVMKAKAVCPVPRSPVRGDNAAPCEAPPPSQCDRPVIPFPYNARRLPHAINNTPYHTSTPTH
ncbi:uncharacterized protein MELLADRAFT_112735 [Melampsora larici-populina 98AG31]|uniref:Uncharacterized protein n=1 Tax=Melampsora larici-populina (strain 98AG31 / pathotype 3-4-7) TaxID=747676 RepID=F4S7F2_MELLP|nr:uncharacterized protein MELLADRAFT_112735 [Melampsora larici-populina 98AG31]EGF99396.1 hypothetical protein MELLADRAFT_112735 [Melampsora larici-populina 98AG31]